MSIFERFKNVKVLVVGDVMLDRYWWGSVKRISPEAPVPVVDLKRATYAPGGAANVAANVAGLGAEPYLVACVGNDADGAELANLLTKANISPEFLTSISSRPTSVKTRIIAHSQQVVRVDQESTDELSQIEHDAIWEKLAHAMINVDAIIISDYAKGLLSVAMLSRLIAEARSLGKTVLVDPKGKDYSRYAGVDLLTPNRREAAEACNLSEDSPDLVTIAGRRLIDELGVRRVLITQSEDGMTLFEKGKDAVHLGTAAKEIYDVTGAGDTVVACLGVALGAGLDFLDAANIANVAAGLVVQQVGTTAITREMLEPQVANVEWMRAAG